MKSKNLFRLAVASIAFLGMLLNANAQAPSKVSGQVSDENGYPLPGVFVAAQGTTVATSTDANGEFTLSVPASSKSIQVSILGYLDQTIELDGRSYYPIIMEVDAVALEEAVAVGYGTMIRSELTSSVASVSGNKLSDRASAMNVNQVMAGKMAGVQIRTASGRPGATGTIRVRGTGSISANNDPLYVVDGVVDVDPSVINYADIEKIDVLKDAAATAMYGAKGANGVIMITTKSGEKGQDYITFSSQTGVNVLARRFDLLNSQEYLDALNKAYLFSGKSAPDYLVTPNEKLFNYQMSGSDYARDENGYLIASPKYDTDWQSVAYRTALITTNNLSFAKSVDNTSIYASLGYQNNQGIYIGTDAKKYTGTVNVKTKMAKWLDVQFAANATRMEEARCAESWGLGWGNSAIENVGYLSPLLPIQYEDGTYGAQNDFLFGNALDNPVKIMDLYTNNYNSNNILLDAGFDFHIIKGLDLTVKGSYNTRNVVNNKFVGLGIKGSTDTENIASITNTDVKRWSNEDYLTYSNVFFGGKLKSNFVLGASWYFYEYETSTGETHGIAQDLYKYHNLGSGVNPRPAASDYDRQTMNSYYFRTNQVLLGRYMLGITLRADGASNFGANKKYGFFPSFSGAWNVAAEPWFEPAKKTINQLKLRLSYGTVGNASIGSYKTFAQYSSGTTYMDGVPMAYVQLNSLANNDLSWESSKQFDAGLDIGLWNDRVNVIADYYIKNSCDLLFNKTIPYTSGYESATMNIGQLRNTGIEITINTHIIDKKNFKWDLDLIWSTNKCIAVDLVDDPFTKGSNSAIRAFKGQEFKWYVFHRVGTWSTDEVEEAAKYGYHPGDAKWQDTNNDGQITYDDRILYGNTLPKGEGSIINTFFWNGFTASIDLGGMYGFYVFNHYAAAMESNFGWNNTTVTSRKAWTPYNQNTMIPALRVSGDDNTGTYWGNEIDDYWVENADFFRIRNVSLSYDFGHKLLKNSKWCKGLLFGVNVENAYLFTNFTGFDPEVGDNAAIDPGALGSYPRPMTITGNLKITF